MATPKQLSEETIRVRYGHMIQAWEILVGYAKNQNCITYTDLSTKMFGKPAPRSRAMMLGQILTYCRQRNLPELPVIVVTKKSKRPAIDAPYEANTISKKQGEVFRLNWDNVPQPEESGYQSY